MAEIMICRLIRVMDVKVKFMHRGMEADSISLHPLSSTGKIRDDYIKTTEQLLKGNYGFMCQYDNEPDFETVWSSIFDLKSLVIYRAEGDQRKKKFISDNRLHDLKFKQAGIIET